MRGSGTARRWRRLPAGEVPHVTCGPDGVAVDRDLAVEHRLVVGVQIPPRRRPGPTCARRREGRPSTIMRRWSRPAHHADARAELDRHVADRQPPSIGSARIAARRIRRRGRPAACRAADQVEDQVLGGDAGGEAPPKGDPHRLRLALDQRLRRENMLDLRGADPPAQSARDRRWSRCGCRRRRASPGKVMPSRGPPRGRCPAGDRPRRRILCRTPSVLLRVSMMR